MRRPNHSPGAGIRLSRSVLRGALGVLLAVGCCAAGVLSGCGSGAKPHKTAAVSPPPASAPVPPHPPPPSPAMLALAAAIKRALRPAGPNTGVSVYDLTTRTSLFTLRDGIGRAPASVEKLYTTAALLSKLTPGTRLQTAVLGSGHLGAGGTWHGNLYFRGGGDPTLGDVGFNRVWELGYGPSAAQLASQLFQAGVRRVSGKVIGDASLFDGRPGVPSSGFAPDIADLGGQLSALTYNHGTVDAAGGPAAFATNRLIGAMHALGIKAAGAPFTTPAPAGAAELASVTSPPLSTLVRLMNVPSDDFFAEMLTKQLGARFAGAGTTAAGARTIASAIASFGVHPKIVDGSGLSRGDRSSPAEVVGLLRDVWRTPLGDVLWDSLPVVGLNGTVRTVALGTPAQDHCLAKTGTLAGITNLAGYCHSRGGQVLTFALFVDGPDNTQGLDMIGKAVAAIARY